jgi:hypothetical protein
VIAVVSLARSRAGSRENEDQPLIVCPRFVRRTRPQRAVRDGRVQHPAASHVTGLQDQVNASSRSTARLNPGHPCFFMSVLWVCRRPWGVSPEAIGSQHESARSMAFRPRTGMPGHGAASTGTVGVGVGVGAAMGAQVRPDAVSR